MPGPQILFRALGLSCPEFEDDSSSEYGEAINGRSRFESIQRYKARDRHFQRS